MRGEGPLKHRLQRRGAIEEEAHSFPNVLAGLRLPLRLLRGGREGKIGLRHGRGHVRVRLKAARVHLRAEAEAALAIEGGMDGDFRQRMGMGETAESGESQGKEEREAHPTSLPREPGLRRALSAHPTKILIAKGPSPRV